MIHIMFAMSIASTGGITSITSAEFNSQKSCEDAREILVQNFTRVYGFGSEPVSGSPELKIKCVPKGEN